MPRARLSDDVPNVCPVVSASDHFLDDALLPLEASAPLRIAFPEVLRSRLRAVEREAGVPSPFTTDTPSTDSLDWKVVGEEMGIPGLEDLIGSAASTVAERITATRTERPHLFNGPRCSIAALAVLGAMGELRVLIGCRRSDFFTSRVLGEVKRLAHQRGWTPDFSEPIRAVNRYAPFVTGFGLNAVLLCQGSGEYKGERVIVLAHRSSKVASAPNQLHTTMTEGFEPKDLAAGAKNALYEGYHRGFAEEVGLRASELGPLQICEVALETTQMALFTVAWTETELSFDEIASREAVDRDLEVERMIQVPLDREAIERCISEYPQPMVPHGRFVLHQVLSRLSL